MPVLVWFALPIVVLNVAVSIAVARSKAFSSLQKLAQCAVVWVLPVLGALAIFFVSRHISRAPPGANLKPAPPEPGPDSEAPQQTINPLSGFLRDDGES
jgi:hypothetical protein